MSVTVPAFISQLTDCNNLLVVAALLAAFLPLSEHLDKLPPEYSERAKVTGQFLILGPQAGGLSALFAIICCLVYSSLPENFVHTQSQSVSILGLGILGTAFFLLCSAVIVFTGVAIIGLAIAGKTPRTKHQEQLSDEDKANLMHISP
jgi:hypothetical protein